jgi:hypothetical protein
MTYDAGKEAESLITLIDQLFGRDGRVEETKWALERAYTAGCNQHEPRAEGEK